jgi:hypothetical protein
MGYNLHITRRKDWSSHGNDITAQEWLSYVESDPELTLSRQSGEYFAIWDGKSKSVSRWLDWHKGNIYTKNPEESLIDKMVAIAAVLHAEVHGDDGEIYRSDHEPPSFRQRPLRDRFLNWLRTLRPVKPLPLKRPAFNVGDRMLDAWQKECTVVAIDPHAEHRLGKVVVRYDDDKIATYALVGEPLRPRNKKEADRA